MIEIREGMRVRFMSIDGIGPVHGRTGIVQPGVGLPNHPHKIIFDGEEDVSYCAAAYLVPIDDQGKPLSDFDGDGGAF